LGIIVPVVGWLLSFLLCGVSEVEPLLRHKTLYHDPTLISRSTTGSKSFTEPNMNG
jgi:hypothetical protein